MLWFSIKFNFLLKVLFDGLVSINSYRFKLDWNKLYDCSLSFNYGKIYKLFLSKSS